jgi:hypothetical protein
LKHTNPLHRQIQFRLVDARPPVFGVSMF